MPFPRKTVVTVLVLAVVVVAADRGTRYVAEQTVASKIQTSEMLPTKPSVDVVGFPFLTQVAGGRFAEIDVTAHGVTRNGLRLETVLAHLTGVDVPRSVVTGSGGVVTVDRAVVNGTLTYPDLNTLLKAQGAPFTVSGVDNGSLTLDLKMTYPVVGEIEVTASGQISDDNGKLRILPVPGSVKAVTSAFPSAVESTINSALSVDISLPRLPYDAKLTGISVVKADVQVEATADSITFDPKKPAAPSS